MKYLKDSEVEAFMKKAKVYYNGHGKIDNRPYLIALLMLRCGLRISEVVGEKYDYFIDDKGHKIVPKPRLKEAKEKGFRHIKNKIEGLRIEDIDPIRMTVTVYGGKGKKDRVTPITQECLDAISQYLMETDRSWKSLGKLIKISVDRVQDWFKEISMEAGIRKVNPHMFRHTFAIIFLNNKGKIRILQKILGHSSLAITEKYLDYIYEDIERDYLEVMERSKIEKSEDAE